MHTKPYVRHALLAFCVLTNVCGTCPAQIDATIPAGLAATAVIGQVGPQGPQGPQGLQGPSGPAGSNATVTAGDGITVAGGVVSLDTTFSDGRYWKQGGNEGTDPSADFIGTADAQPMELRTDNQRALRFEHVTDNIRNAINMLAGSPANSFQGDETVAATICGGGYLFGNEMHGNSVTAKGGSIVGGWDNQAGELALVGGGSNNVAAIFSVVGGGYKNVGAASFSTIAGGDGNIISNEHSFIGGGYHNKIEGAFAYFSVIGGGDSNFITGTKATIAGGFGNQAGKRGAISGGQSNITGGDLATVGGGYDNQSTGDYSVIPGGRENAATGHYSFAAGYKAQAVHDGTFVWADSINLLFSSTAPNQFCIRAGGGARFQQSNTAIPGSITNTTSALQVENFLNSEAVWLRTANAVTSTSRPVLKLHRHPDGTNGFIRGYDWTGTGAATAKFTIDKDGAYNAGGDFAEALRAVGGKAGYEPGDVVILSEEQPGAVEKCCRAADAKVAGVYSTRPGVIGISGNDETRLEEDDIAVAITGIVPTKVSCENGSIRPGDLLTTSKTPGCAMRAKPVTVGGVEIYPTGTIIGKAIESLEKGTGKIRVLITLK